MERHVVRLIRDLRRDGLSVSTGEELDALQALTLVELADRELVRLALRGALVKDRAFFPLFDKHFASHFTWRVQRLRKKPAGKGKEAGKGNGSRPSDDKKPSARSGPGAPDSKGPPGPKRPSPVSGQTPPAPNIESAHESPARPADGEHRQPEETGIAGTADGLRSLQETVEKILGVQPEEARSRGEGLQERRRNLRQARFTAPLAPEDERRIDEEIDRLARTLLARKSRREGRSKGGRVDLKRIMRENLQTDGVPFVLPHKRRRLERSELVILCDVSWSVRKASRFLLRLLFAIQRKFSHLRSFAFVNRPVEITPLAAREDFPACLAGIPELDSHLMSDYGNTFYRFLEDFGRTLSRRTILVILGDARNNRLDPLLWALEELAGRAKEVIWLNPEEKERWDRDDSVISGYARYCRAALECGSVEQLSKAVRIIVHRGMHHG